MVSDASLDTTPRAELLERLESALRLLPPAERRAVLTAHASDDGLDHVAGDMGLSAEEADALTRNAVQLLRGALADLEPEPTPDFPRLAPPDVMPTHRPE
jgi:DNA-directed RNA polymerase specialized sigma24 family protein